MWSNKHISQKKDLKVVVLIAAIIGAVWPDDQIICLIFGHLQQWKFDQQHLKFAKISSNVAKYLINPYKWPKFFNLVPKWRKFDKSGHIEFICHGLFLFICVFAKQCESNWINGDTKNGQKGVWTVDLYYLRRPLNRLSQIQWPSDNAKREHCDKL